LRQKNVMQKAMALAAIERLLNRSPFRARTGIDRPCKSG
jgi:hypothetical protein